jgi:Golgi phosphoprotein 3 (GPP34)
VAVGDAFFRVAHNDVSGRPRLSTRVLSVGLAAALVGELVTLRQVEVRDELRVVDRRPPRDALAHTVLEELVAQRRPLPVRVWLSYLADSAYDRVADRLTRAGQLTPQRSGVPWGRGVTYVPTDMNVAAVPRALLSQKLRRGVELEYDDVCLAGLVLATGLDVSLLDGAEPVASERLRWAVSQLWPPMLRLVQHTQAAVGDAVLSHRT